MKFQFGSKELSDLYETGQGSYSEAIIKAFFKKIQLINNAKDENDLRRLQSNHFEKLQGEKNLYSIRLNIQFRLILELLKDGQCKIILIKEISKHYEK
jgi:plasmid maintenance system killer protein